MQSLRDLAVLVAVSFGAYSPRSIDKAETKKINDHNGAKGTPHRVIRDRLSGTKAGEILAEIMTAQAEARRLFYERTVPWDDSGRRMAANDAAHDLLIELRRHQGIINAKVSAFVNAWPNAETEARAVFNGGWKDEYTADYRIAPEEMRRKFKAQIELESLPNAQDLRLAAPDALLQEMIKQAETAITERFEAGCKDAHRRLYEAIQHIHDKLADPKAVFRDSLIGNLSELLDLLPAINIGKDPELTRIAQSAQKKLLAFDLPATLAGLPEATASTESLAQRLRDDKSHRANAAKAANDILADMRAYMGSAPK